MGFVFARSFLLFIQSNAIQVMFLEFKKIESGNEKKYRHLPNPSELCLRPHHKPVLAFVYMRIYLNSRIYTESLIPKATDMYDFLKMKVISLY